MPHLASLTIAPRPEAGATYPFSVPAVRATRTLPFVAPVTFFVGENGSGKSTLLEGLAVAAALPTVGSASVTDDATLVSARAFGGAMRLAWSRRTHRGFFLRAEDFFGFTKSVAMLRGEMQQRLAEQEIEYADASKLTRDLALGPARGSLAALTRSYGADLDANSHGQSFLKLFQSRFVPGGLYLLDEPEAPLSPQSQLALIAMLDEMVQQDAQFIIATHSPLLLAFPGATIISFDESPPGPVAYESLDHVTVTRDFLNAPDRYLRHLTSARPSSPTP